jgi:hypothetical protein
VTQTTESDSDAPGHGVVVRAQNGDVIRYDPSGLVMRLSDKVIADIALRMGVQPAAGAVAGSVGGVSAKRVWGFSSSPSLRLLVPEAWART